MRIFGTLMAIAVVVAGVRPGAAADGKVDFEVGVSRITASSSSSAEWGWWNPGKYDEWTAEDLTETRLTDVRMKILSPSYIVILAGEWYPTLEAEGRSDLAFTQDQLVQQLSFETSVYDLGIGQWFGRSRRTGLMPWIGATYMRLDERRVTELPAGSSDPDPIDRADAGLWGVVAGVDGSIELWSTVDLTGRLLLRWATGTRRATINSDDPVGGGSGGPVTVSDSIDAGMWGVDLGLRWNATRAFRLELGWRYRDQTYDGGPASYGGPQIRAGYVF